MSGEVKTTPTPKNIDDLIDQWHNSDSEQELHEFLGWTFEQYSHWTATNEFPV
jgi:hypothetical protein